MIDLCNFHKLEYEFFSDGSIRKYHKFNSFCWYVGLRLLSSNSSGRFQRNVLHSDPFNIRRKLYNVASDGETKTTELK